MYVVSQISDVVTYSSFHKQQLQQLQQFIEKPSEFLAQCAMSIIPKIEIMQDKIQIEFAMTPQYMFY